MAPGYCFAIALEAAGLLALALGVMLTRHERRAKSVGLKRFLTSAQATGTATVPATPARPRREPPAPRVQSASSPHSGAVSEAALALRSAFAGSPAR